MKKANSADFTGCLAVEQLEQKKKSVCSTASYLEICAQLKETLLCLVKQNLPFDPLKNWLEALILFLL